MRWKTMQLALWTLGTLLSAVSCLAIDANTAETPTAPAPAHAVNTWPWLALGAIVVVLFVIARVARRRLPFGRL